MSDSPQTPPSPSSPLAPPRRRASGLVRVATAFGALVLAGLALAFFLASDSGVRHIILPRLSKQLGVEIAAKRVAWHPFSSLEIEKLRVGPADRPLLELVRLSVRYRGWALLRGRFEAKEIQAESPSIHLVEKEDGTIADLPKAFQAPAAQTATPSSSRDGAAVPPPILARIDSLTFRNLRFVREAPGARIEIGPVNLSARNLRPGGAATLDLQLGFSMKREALKTEEAETRGIGFTGNAHAKVSVKLDDAFLPRAAKGDLGLENLAGHVGVERLDGLSATLRFDHDLGANGKGLLREGVLSVERSGVALAAARVAGLLDFAGKEAELDVQIGPLDQALLNPIFGTSRLDFRGTQLDYTGHLSMRHGGDLIRAEGRLAAHPLAVTSSFLPPEAFGPTQILLEHGVEVDVRARRATVFRLNLDAQRVGGAPLLKGALSRPMTLSWKEGETFGAPAEDSEFNLQIMPLEMAAFAPWLHVPSDWKLRKGTFAGTLKIAATEQGHLLALEGRLGVASLILTTPEIAFTDAAAQLAVRANLRDLKILRFEKNSFRFTEKGVGLAEATLDGNWDLAAGAGAGQATLSVPIPAALALRPVPGLAVSSGAATVTADWKCNATGRVVSRTSASLNDVALTWHDLHYPRFGARLDVLLDWSAPELRANDARLTWLADEKPAGTLLAHASWQTHTGVFRARLEAADWQPSPFAPLVAAWLPGRTLRSLALSGHVEVAFDGAALTLNAKSDAKNLLFGGADAKGFKPLNAGLSADLSWNTNGTLALRSVALQLDPVGKANNRLEASGSMRVAPRIFFANLKIHGQSLDLTPWYDQLFSADAPPASPSSTPAKSKANPAPPSPPGMASAATPESAPPRVLDLTLDAQVDSLRAREFTLARLAIPLRIKGDLIEMTDAHATLGGAPVNVSIQSEKTVSGAPPFRFDAKTENLPIGPLMDAFVPSLAGQIGGVLTARAYGTGRGLSREDLERNIEGHVEVALRDAHLERTTGLRKALAKLGALLASPEITASTMDRVDASAKIAGGKLSTDNLHVKGSALEADLRGDLYFDQRLAMEASLKMNRTTMNKSALLVPIVQAASAERDDWLRIPGGAKVGGTLSEPEIAVDKSKFARDTLINTGVNFLKQMIEKKQAPPPTDGGSPAPPPSTPKENPVQNLFDNLLKKK
ncbi:MAG: hypothetical protein IT578_11400 [Verrucomicrobiae bacterium]|nr:hypothetical protein [Verrucomicrobiae bacterium]